MTDRKKVDIAIFECSEENEIENLRQVVICPPFQNVGKEGRHQDPRRRTRKDNQMLNADCDSVCDLVLRGDSKSLVRREQKIQQRRLRGAMISMNGCTTRDAAVANIVARIGSLS
jgi:hypothetical protein